MPVATTVGKAVPVGVIKQFGPYGPEYESSAQPNPKTASRWYTSFWCEQVRSSLTRSTLCCKSQRQSSVRDCV